MTQLAVFYPNPPYNFRLTASLSRYYTTLGRLHEGAYRRALHAGDGVALVEITPSGTLDTPALNVSLLAEQGDVDRAALLVTLERMLNLHLDLRPFYALVESDPFLRRVVEPLYGLHILQTETLHEALTVTIIEQQITLAGAQKGERWLIGWAGDSIVHEGETYFTFPRAERLAAAVVADLVPLKTTFRRMQTLIDVARGADALEALRDQPLPDAYAAVMRLKGVGHWTAAWMLTRGLGEFVYVGSADVALRSAANLYFYGQTGRADRAITDATFARYGTFAGLAGFYTLMKWAVDRYPREG